MSGSDTDNNTTDSFDSDDDIDKVSRIQKVSSVLEYLKYASDNEINDIYSIIPNTVDNMGLGATHKAMPTRAVKTKVTKSTKHAKTVKSAKSAKKAKSEPGVYSVTNTNVSRKIKSDAINAERVKALLKLSNEILQAAGKDPIDDLAEFSIKRDEITSDAVEQVVIKADYLFKDALYDKRLCGWYYRNTVQSYPITLMKALIKQTDGYAFISKANRIKGEAYTSYIVTKTRT